MWFTKWLKKSPTNDVPKMLVDFDSRNFSFVHLRNCQGFIANFQPWWALDTWNIPRLLVICLANALFYNGHDLFPKCYKAQWHPRIKHTQNSYYTRYLFPDGASPLIRDFGFPNHALWQESMHLWRDTQISQGISLFRHKCPPKNAYGAWDTWAPGKRQLDLRTFQFQGLLLLEHKEELITITYTPWN